MIYATLLLALWLGIPNVQLQETFDIDTPEILALTPESLLVNRHNALVEFDLKSGMLINTITMDDRRKGQELATKNALSIQTFGYLEDLDLIIILAGRHLEKGQTESELRLYDRFDQSYQKGTLSPELGDVLVRQFLFTKSGRLFLNLQQKPGGSANRDTLTEADKRILTEVEIFSNDGTFELRPVGERFHEQRKAFEKWPELFKLRWLVEKDEQVYVINQLQPVLKSYDFSISKLGIPEETERYLNVENWISPYLRKTINDVKWMNSFSKNSGLALIYDGFVFTYNSPNINHPYYAEEGEAKRDVNIPFHLLNIQKLNSFGKVTGTPVQVPGGFFAGVHGSSAVVVKQQNNHATIQFVDLSSLN